MVAVVAFDGVVLGDLSIACEVFGLARRKDGTTAYDVRVCKWVCEKQTIQVQRVVTKQVPVTYTYKVPRTIVYRVPVDPCEG